MTKADAPKADTPKTETPETETTQATTPETRTVKVNYENDKVADGAGFIHPESKQVITGKKSQALPADDWTDQMIRDKIFTEIRK